MCKGQWGSFDAPGASPTRSVSILVFRVSVTPITRLPAIRAGRIPRGSGVKDGDMKAGEKGGRLGRPLNLKILGLQGQSHPLRLPPAGDSRRKTAELGAARPRPWPLLRRRSKTATPEAGQNLMAGDSMEGLLPSMRRLG